MNRLSSEFYQCVIEAAKSHTKEDVFACDDWSEEYEQDRQAQTFFHNNEKFAVWSTEQLRRSAELND